MEDREKIEQHVRAVPAYLNDQRMSDVLKQIPNLERRLYCLHRYIRLLDKRGANWVDDRWAYTKDEYKEWRKTEDFKLRKREIRAIQNKFKASNPGYWLIAGSKHRPLPEQIGNWNKNKSVRLNSEKYYEAMEKEVRKPIYLSLDAMLEAPTPKCREGEGASIRAFYDFLNRKSWPKPKLMVAAPGLSAHGTGLAIDFVVRKEGGPNIVTATNAERWINTGWAGRLANAMRGAAHFSGPLKQPNEPWHWTFDPD
ncbi:hypothetical protein FMN50_00120 [Rhodobacterales bacterium]|nr:hypothetical protein FMN50_00120 [Rhodobacterales bacterium]